MGKLQSATDTVKELIGWFGAALGGAVVGFSLFEHVNPWDAFWWSWVTATTTGYGVFFVVLIVLALVAN